MKGPIFYSDFSQLLFAISFSAQKHSRQRRKDRDASPYINHPIEVARIIAEVGQVTDLQILVAAVLHDTLEDTKTSASELESRFGSRIRQLVEEVTEDKNLEKSVRKELQVKNVGYLTTEAKLIRIADKICNVQDVTHSPPVHWGTKRQLEYLDWTERVIAGCRGANGALENYYDDVLRKGRQALGKLP